MREMMIARQSVNDSRQQEDREFEKETETERYIYRVTSTVATVYIETLRYVIQ